MGMDRAPFLVSCSTKSKEKRKRKEESAEEEEAAALFNSLSLNNLTDCLLIQILLRLPTAESVFSSKLVCKRWCSLTSTPYFITQFITHHININETRNSSAAYRHPPSVFIAKRGDPRILFVNQSPLPFSLEFPVEDRNTTVSILASCNDLLFCITTSEQDYSTFNAINYICNPFTKQRLLLPSPPKRETFSTKSTMCFFGLVCEPNYQRWAVQGQQQQYGSRYRLLRFTWIAKLQSVMDIYCSETGQWNEFLLSGKNYSRSNGNVVAYDGKLYWYTASSVASYDPFNHGEIIFFQSPEFKLPLIGNPYLSFARVSVYLGVCQGSLRLMRLATYITPSSANQLSVWELDYETRRLCLTHKIFFYNMFSKEPMLPDLLSVKRRTPRAIALDPNDKNVVYLGSWDVVISCNLQTGELDLVHLLPYDDFLQIGQEVFPISLPWWPTPVSMLPQNGHL